MCDELQRILQIPTEETFLENKGTIAGSKKLEKEDLYLIQKQLRRFTKRPPCPSGNSP